MKPSPPRRRKRTMNKEEKTGIIIGFMLLTAIAIGWVAHEPEPCAEPECEKCQRAWCFDLEEVGPTADEQNHFLRTITLDNESLNWSFFPCIRLTGGWYYCQNEDESGKYFTRYGCKGEDNKGFACGEEPKIYVRVE